VSRQRKSHTPNIPAELREAAAAEAAAEEDQRRAFRERAERGQRLADAVKAFRDAANALWTAPPDQARPLLPPVHTSFLSAVQALAESDRLGAWEEADHDATYAAFRCHNYRVLSRPSYDWACELLGKARGGELPGALLAKTWETKGLRDTVRWLHILVHGLAGEGAVLPSRTQAPALSKADGERPAEPAGGMTWQEAAERMKRLRDQGEPWTSQHNLADQFRCSSATINKAIKNTPDLQAWVKPQEAAAPKAQSLSGWKPGVGYIDVVTDSTAQSRELDPADEVAIREFIEQADPETKAWFLALTPNKQLEVVNDPDKHQRILGRKP
jgi:hypothetical protein